MAAALFGCLLELVKAKVWDKLFRAAVAKVIPSRARFNNKQLWL